MKIDKVSCVSCGATLQIREDNERLTCSYCATQYLVQRGDGYVDLKIAEKVSQSIKDVGQQTQDTIREGAQITRAELKRMQLRQELALIKVQLTSIQGEIRTLEREEKTGKVRLQLNDLRRQEQQLLTQIKQIQAILTPPQNLPVAKPTQATQVISPKLFLFLIVAVLVFLGICFTCMTIFSVGRSLSTATPTDSLENTPRAALKTEKISKSTRTSSPTISPSATEKPTFTITSTSSGTPVPTKTPTPSATIDPSYTPPTPTITNSPTLTFTPSKTPTSTATHTSTPTSTRTSTPTKTLTSTKTLTPTRTSTPIPESAGLSDWIVYEGKYIGVRKVAFDYYLGYYHPDEGKIYISLYIVAINMTDREVSFFDSDFALVDGGGEVTGGVVFAEKEPYFDFCTVQPGGSCEGWWTTMIRDKPEVKNNLVFRWDPGWFVDPIDVAIQQ